MVIVMLMVHGTNSFQLMRSYLRKFQLNLFFVLLIYAFLSNDDDHHLSATLLIKAKIKNGSCICGM
jgi:hypothetical protein